MAACARMILAGFGQHLLESNLRVLLKTRASTGTHPINFRNLESLGLEAIWPFPATMADMRDLLADGIPVVVFVWTGALKHWPPTAGVDYLHALVVVGFTQTSVTLHDPKLANGPIEMPFEDFSTAWTLADHLIAYLRPRR